MKVAQRPYTLGPVAAFEDEINLNAPGESDWIIIPAIINVITVTVSFTGGASGKMQTTTDPNDNFSSAVSVDWPFGEKSETFSATCKPVSGLRAVQVGTGTMKITIRTQ